MPIPVLSTAAVNSVRRVLSVAATAVASPFTLSQQVQDWGGRRWDFEVGFALAVQAEGRRLAAFFAALGGPVGVFLFRDPTIRKSATGSAPAVLGAGQSGRSLVTNGWTGAGLLAGDFFSLGADEATRLYQLTADVVPVAGQATLQFVPALRSPPANGAALEIHAPAVALRLSGPVPADIGLGEFHQFSITASEAI